MGISLFAFYSNPTFIAKRVQMCCYFIRMKEPREMTDAFKKPVNQDIAEYAGFNWNKIVKYMPNNDYLR